MDKREEGGDEDQHFLFKKQEIIKEIEKLLHVPVLKIFYLSYKEDLLKKSILKNEVKLMNRSDDYSVWTMEAVLNFRNRYPYVTQNLKKYYIFPNPGLIRVKFISVPSI